MHAHAHILYGIPTSTPRLLQTCASSLPLPPQEEERERRLDYVPDESALNTNAIEVCLCVCAYQEASWRLYSVEGKQVPQQDIIIFAVCLSALVGTMAGMEPAAEAAAVPQAGSAARRGISCSAEQARPVQCSSYEPNDVQLEAWAVWGLGDRDVGLSSGDTAQLRPRIAKPLV